MRIDGDRAIALVPLATASASLGTLEIDASEDRLLAAWDVIPMLGGHLAATLQATKEFDRLRREVRTLEAASLLGRRLAHAPTTAAGIEMAVRFLGSRFRVPVAGWRIEPDGTCTLAATAGARAPVRAALTVATVETDARATEARSAALRDAFARTTGMRRTVVFDAGPALLIAGRDRLGGVDTIDEVGALLIEMLRLHAANAAATARRRQLDMGLAWTAHELRGPLLGVRATLEAMDGHDPDPRHRAMMQSSVRELDQLMGTTDALLTWAAGTRSLHRAPEDLVGIVRDAIASNRIETGVDGIITDAPRDATVDVDRQHIRTAIVNLLRNAAVYADPGTTIEVAVVPENDDLILRVTDVGPAIPAAERHAIFDPFVRGETPGRAREGSGLGLFITRRVVEAHGGSIWVESGGRRTTFSLALPAERRGARRFAS